MDEDNSNSGVGLRTDLGWKYAILVDEKKKNDIKCAFCGKVSKGGIHRHKQHLVGGFRNVTGCSKVPLEVKNEIANFMQQKKMASAYASLQNAAMFDFEDQFDGDDEEEDELGLERGMGKASKHKGKAPIGRGGVSISNAPSSQRPHQKGTLRTYFTQAPQVSNQWKVKKKFKQTTIPERYDKEGREATCLLLAEWIYQVGIPFNVVRPDSFRIAMDAVAQFGPGFKPPTYHEIRDPFLKKTVTRTHSMMKDHQDEWKRIGCTLMSDGWTDKRGRTLINFLVNSPKGTMFLGSIDASSYVKI